MSALIPTPRFGVVVLVTRDQEVLLCKRTKPPALGKWMLPGGRIDFLEGYREAAGRVARAWAGLDIVVGSLLDVRERITPPYEHGVALLLSATTNDVGRCGADVDGVRFFSRMELLRLAQTNEALAINTQQVLTETGWVRAFKNGVKLVSREDVATRFRGKTVAIVGSGPGCLQNRPGAVDKHDIVVRVNNYKIMQPSTGKRTDVYYSFFGNSIKKEVAELKGDGVVLCMCKCPDALTYDSPWHRHHNKMAGVDFRWIYDLRKDWWFCDVYIPDRQDFMTQFEMLNNHVPTTGFSAIQDILSFGPKAVYLTGFDFFRSRRHNVTQIWKEQNKDDPIGHVPEVELAWLKANWKKFPLSADPVLSAVLGGSSL